jgi:hypothetical protein
MSGGLDTWHRFDSLKQASHVIDMSNAYLDTMRESTLVLFFLNAGAARLQIFVRPGFEDLVKHFMETGEVYEGNGIPKIGDPGYAPFIDEQISALGGPGDEVPWPSLENLRQWDIVSPTQLFSPEKLLRHNLNCRLRTKIIKITLETSRSLALNIKRHGRK